jgi:hypothetical protein
MLQCRKAMNLLGHSSGQGAACQALNFNSLAGILARFGENWFLADKEWPVPAKIARSHESKTA